MFYRIADKVKNKNFIYIKGAVHHRFFFHMSSFISVRAIPDGFLRRKFFKTVITVIQAEYICFEKSEVRKMDRRLRSEVAAVLTSDL